MSDVFSGKNILVTGGAGSVGRALVKKLFEFEPEVIRVFDSNESGLHSLRRQYEKRSDVRFLLGDVRDKDRVFRAMENINIVFHCASLKHVPTCEYDPFEAIKTNIIGTENVIEAAIDRKAERLVNVSTDKACNPVSVMGATKLLAERLVTQSSLIYKSAERTVLCSCRFGNLLDAEGTAVELFKQQAAKGGPITLTDVRMTRFFTTSEEASKFVVECCEIAKGGEVFVMKNRACNMNDVAKAIAGTEGGNKEIKILETGARQHEKLAEELASVFEAKHGFESEEMLILLPQTTVPDWNHSYGSKFKRAKEKSYSSDSEKPLSQKEILGLLEKIS
jgi:FlaA1/EpsC-like NDP-sugar epimerase